ncbi:peptidoglycan recognition protein 1-like isoform X2 [Dermacentor variabilis]|uniref:peptidoglycan recognition protein 1-like isoform X2 n=1 Tax=Dermacentor variabilis TaxID=34621 RepID=UPI003F5BFBAC
MGCPAAQGPESAQGPAGAPVHRAPHRGSGMLQLLELLGADASLAKLSHGHESVGTSTTHARIAGWDDLGYSFLIGGDGRVYVSRGWDRSGAHTKGHNDDALAAAFIGDFSRHLPTPWAVGALVRLLNCGVALGKIRPDYTLHGHRDANCRTCPGDALYAYISRWRHFGGKLKKYICENPATQPSATERVSTQRRTYSI